MKQDDDLKALRQRGDFTELVNDLETRKSGPSLPAGKE